MRIYEKTNNEIKLKGVPVNTDTKFKNIPPPLPDNNGWSMLIIGLPGSGKTSLYQSIVKYYKGQFAYIYYFNSSLNTINDNFLSKLSPERVFSDLSPIEEIVKSCKEGKYEYTDKKLFIIDDLVFQLKDYEKTLQQLLMNRRHMSASIILITQKTSQVPLSVRSQFDNIIYFSGLSKTENVRLYQDYIQSLDKEEFEAIINYIFDGTDNHVFLYIDKKNNKYYKKFNQLILEQ